MVVMESNDTCVESNVLECENCNQEELKANLVYCAICGHLVCDNCRIGRYCINCLNLHR